MSRLMKVLTIVVFVIAILTYFLLTPGHVKAGEMNEEVVAEIQQPVQLAIPTGNNAYGGAYVDFGDREDTVTPSSLKEFEKLVGRKQAIIGFSSDWGNGKFPTEQLKVISSYGAVPLVYWSPWDRPLGAPQARNRFHLQRILDGAWDAYIDMWSAEAKKYNKPLLIAWGLEMNGQWFPWSGNFYGGGAAIANTDPPQYEGPEMFKKAYRYVVDRVRKNGASNMQWVFHANNTSDPPSPWNSMAQYYPGKDYVDWLGMSAYGQQYPDQGWAQFEKVIPAPYNELTALDPDKPVILAEWGIGEFPESGNKAAWLDEAFKRLTTDFPRIKAAVYWHERWINGDQKYSNLRVNSSAEALVAFRKGVADPFWLDRPIFEAYEEVVEK